MSYKKKIKKNRKTIKKISTYNIINKMSEEEQESSRLWVSKAGNFIAAAGRKRILTDRRVAEALTATLSSAELSTKKYNTVNAANYGNYSVLHRVAVGQKTYERFSIIPEAPEARGIGAKRQHKLIFNLIFTGGRPC